MPESNILPFPTRAIPEPGGDRSDFLLAKIATALRAMKELHAELEDLKAALKIEAGATSPD
jgi:hypothetical protein